MAAGPRGAPAPGPGAASVERTTHACRAAGRPRAPGRLLLAALLGATPGAVAGQDTHPLAAALEALAAGQPRLAAELVDRERFPPELSAEVLVVRALIALAEERPAEARAALDAALALAPERAAAHLYRAQAMARLQLWQEAERDLQRAARLGLQPASWYSLAAACASGQGDDQRAYLLLAGGRERHPEHLLLAEQQLQVLLALGLHGAAGDLARELTARAGRSVAALLAQAAVERRAGRLTEAEVLLDEARLAAPEALAPRLALGRLLAQQGRHHGAAAVFAAAWELAPEAWRDELALAAAEQHRLAGALAAALRWNGRVGDPQARDRQRLGLLAAAGELERAALLAERLLQGDPGDERLRELAQSILARTRRSP